MVETIKKLKFKGKGTVINAPIAIESELLAQSFTNTYNQQGLTQNTLVFLYNKTDLLRFLDDDLQKIEPDSVLWLAYPKLSSKIKTDIHRDIIMQTVEGYGITTVTAISIDVTWSGLRLRPIGRVGR